MATKFYAIVAGVGSGTGRSIALKFSKTYSVILLARSEGSYTPIVTEIKSSGGHAVGISADVADSKSVASAFAAIKKEIGDGHIAAAIYNVGGGFVRKPFLETTEKDYVSGFESNGLGLFNFAKESLPLLLASVSASPNPPSLILTGATASMRGSALCGGFASGKFAMRALGQSLAREFGPQGVHVAHAIIDGGIDIPRSKGWLANDGKPDGKLSPDAIADSYWYLHTQPRSTFTQELDMRPYVEKF